MGRTQWLLRALTLLDQRQETVRVPLALVALSASTDQRTAQMIRSAHCPFRIALFACADQGVVGDHVSQNALPPHPQMYDLCDHRCRGF